MWRLCMPALGFTVTETTIVAELFGLMIVVGQLESEVSKHVQRALGTHLRWCRDNGVPVPSDVSTFFDLLASGVQRQPNVAEPLTVTDDRSMDLLTLNYQKVADRLNVSGRTVRRLVENELLASVDVGGCVRVRTTDRAAYVNGLEPR